MRTVPTLWPRLAFRSRNPRRSPHAQRHHPRRDAGPGDIDEPRVYLFTGTVRATFDADVITELQYSGRVRDICAEL
jgi:hypothetical protein